MQDAVWVRGWTPLCAACAPADLGRCLTAIWLDSLLPRNRKSAIGNREYLLLVLLSLSTQAVFLASPARRGLPLDDGWIHATYARNLALHGQLCLNLGEPSTGTTSFLWTALLAALRLVCPDPVLCPILLGLVLQAWLVVCCCLLVREAMGDDAAAFAAAASCALLGNLVWISLSGMEATLFLALGLSAIGCRTRGRLLTAGILMGLLVLTRPEGLALPLAMALVELSRRWPPFRNPRSAFRDWLRLFAPVAAGAAIYFAINLAITGHLLTSTYAGRRWLAGQPAGVELGPMAIGGRLLDFAGSWVRYLYRWVLGMVLLAWLGVPGAEVAGGVLGVLVVLLAVLALAGLRRKGLAAGARPSPLPLLVIWALAHNAAYVVLLPVHGHAGRYQAINFVLLAILAALGAARLARARGRLRQLGLAALGLWLSLALGSAVLWRAIYRDSVDHINAVHVACGRWVAENLPRDAVVATYDLGAISYFAERRVVDLGGLADPEMARHLFAGDVTPYLRRKGATHIVLIQHDPNDLTLARRLGLLPPSPDRPRLQFARLWEIPPERYRLHHPATSNATPLLALYRLEWR